MSRLFLVIHTMAMTVLMGVAITAVLALNLPGWKPVALAAAAGFLIAIPVSWLIARKLEHLS